jgi:hypothetical protein
MRTYLVIVFALVASGCHRIEPAASGQLIPLPTPLEIGLRFDKIPRQCKQGVASFTMELVNLGAENSVLPRWVDGDEGQISSNFGIFAVNGRGDFLRMDQIEPMSSVFYTDFWILRNEAVPFEVFMNCSLPPDTYRIQAYLRYYPSIRTEWYYITVTKGELLDPRK